ncbi:MAG: DUF4169 family protein [Pseudomonadota bacterium]
MAEPINLNKARKARQKANAKQAAAENRVRHGRTKAEKRAAEAEADRLRSAADPHKRDHPLTDE